MIYIVIIPNPGENHKGDSGNVRNFPSKHSEFRRTKIDGHKNCMLPVWFAMCVCSFLQIVFVESGRFVYNETRNCALKFIRLQQNENSVVGLFMPKSQNENYVTTSPSRPICRAWTAPLSAV